MMILTFNKLILFLQNKVFKSDFSLKNLFVYIKLNYYYKIKTIKLKL